MSKRWLAAAGFVLIAFMARGGGLPAAENYELSIIKGNTFLRKQMYQEALDAYENAIQLKQVVFQKSAHLQRSGQRKECLQRRLPRRCVLHGKTWWPGW